MHNALSLAPTTFFSANHHEPRPPGPPVLPPFSPPPSRVQMLSRPSPQQPPRREVFMNVPAERPPIDQSFEVHGNVVLIPASSDALNAFLVLFLVRLPSTTPHDTGNSHQ